MKKYLLLLISTFALAQTNPQKIPKLAITSATKLNTATRVMVQDSITKEVHWVLKSTVGGTVTSVTGTDGITVANGTTTPVIGLGNITPTTATTSNVTYMPTSAPTYAEGKAFYDSSAKTLVVYDDISGTATNLGQELNLRARNNTGVTIANGSVVYISGATGQNPTIALARANSLSTSVTIGIATHDIANNTVGKITTFGLVNDLNTSSFTDGQVLYLSPNTAGILTATVPSSPNYTAYVCVVLHSHVTQGKIFVRPEQPISLNVALTDNNNISPSVTAVKSYIDTGLGLKSNIASPTFTGVPTAPTALSGTNTTQLATTAFVQANTAASAYWTKTGDDIQNNNLGNTSVKLLSGKYFYLYNNVNTIIASIDELGVGKFGNPSTYTSFGPASSNISLSMVRPQMGADFTIGNPGISQPYGIRSDNYFGTNYWAGSSEISANAVAEHSFNIGNVIGNGITSGIFRIARNRVQATVPIKYATDLSASYDVRTLVDKGYIDTRLGGTGNGITGTGTTNFIPKWTGLGTQGNSRIIDDGTLIGFGATPGNYDPPADETHLFQFINNGTTKQVLSVTSAGNTTYSNNLHWYRYRGSLAAPTATLANDYFMSMGFRGHDGANISQSAAAFQALTTSNWTPTSTPVKFVFQTTNIGQTFSNRATALEIRENQDVFVANNLLVFNPVKNSWNSNYKVINMTQTSGLRSHTAASDIALYNNLYFDTAYKYGYNGIGSNLLLDQSGSLIYQTAPSGLAGATATVTNPFTVFSNGNTLIGTQSSISGIDPKLIIKQGGDGDWRGLNVAANGNDSFFGIHYNGTNYDLSASFASTAGYKDISISTSGVKRLNVDVSGVVKITNLSGTGDRIVGTHADGSLYATTSSVAPIQLKDFYTDVSNLGITETDLYTYPTDISRLNTTGEKLVAVYAGSFNDATASSQIKVVYAGVVVGDTGALTMSVTGAWIVNASIMRTGATTARAMVNISTPGASTASYTKYTSLTGLTFGSTNIIKITGTASGATGGDNDITASYGNILWQPAAL